MVYPEHMVLILNTAPKVHPTFCGIKQGERLGKKKKQRMTLGEIQEGHLEEGQKLNESLAV